MKVQREERYISKDHRRLYCLKRHQQHNSGRCVKTGVKIIADVYDRQAFERLCVHRIFVCVCVKVEMFVCVSSMPLGRREVLSHA